MQCREVETSLCETRAAMSRGHSSRPKGRFMWEEQSPPAKSQHQFASHISAPSWKWALQPLPWSYVGILTSQGDD